MSVPSTNRTPAALSLFILRGTGPLAHVCGALLGVFAFSNALISACVNVSASNGSSSQ
jgi:hypothetical protein